MLEIRTRSSWARTDRLCAAGVLLVTLAHLAYYFPRVVDDLFISLRYAENLARGQGAVYNVGERVEGFSSPLWMLLQSAGIRLTFEGVTWTKVLGVSSLLLLEWALFKLARERFGILGWHAWLASLACATNSYVVNWSVLGLETPLHLALIALAPIAIQPERAGPRSAANLIFVALGLSRPESGLYLLATLAAPFSFTRSRAAALSLARQSLALLWPGITVLGVLLLLRHGYYGRWLPNTADVKAGTLSPDLSHLAPLVGQGAGIAETLVYVGGGLALCLQGWRQRELRPALYVLGCLAFTLLVKLDWMPSLRHLLPVTVLAPLGIISLGASFQERDGWRARVGGWASAALLGANMLTLLPIDNRNSPEENRGRGWIRPKLASKWRDTLLAYQRVTPPHVQRMKRYEMGQITQAWHVLECSAEPIEDSWYVGRDIGAVGYYTGVLVYDTAGLFTPEVSHSEDWTSRRIVSDELIESAMSRRPLAGEIYEGWELALGRHPELLTGYRVRAGTARAPVAFLATDRPKPPPELVLERYRRMLAKFPRLYHLHTLYGEAVGAAVEKRAAIVADAIAGGAVSSQ